MDDIIVYDCGHCINSTGVPIRTGECANCSSPLEKPSHWGTTANIKRAEWIRDKVKP